MVMKYVRSRRKSLGLIELVAIAIGGMVGGGIFFPFWVFRYRSSAI